MKNRIIQWGKARLFTQLFNDEKKAVFEKLDQLEHALYSLQFEGKTFSSGHIKKAEEAVCFLKNEFANHINLDDRVIFPFLEKHIPRLRPVLLYLKAERFEFQAGFKIFEKILSELKRGNKTTLRHSIIGRLKDKGIYLVCLMRSHIQLEEESVYKSIAKELPRDERNALIEKIALNLG